MTMVLEGTIKEVVGIQEGVSKRTGKPWKEATYVLTTDGQYPKDVAFSVFDEDRINEMSLIAGERVRLGIDIESREWNGKWYTNVRAYVKLDVEDNNTPQPKAQEPTPAQPIVEQVSVDKISDLPF